MKIIRKDVAYVQNNDIARLMHSSSMIPASLFDSLFSTGCFIVVDENRYDFVEFRNEEDIEFFEGIDWIVDYDELNKLSDEQLEELGNKIVNEQNNIADAYNFMTQFERKKNQHLIEKYEKLEHQLNSISAFALFRRGKIEMTLPEEIIPNKAEEKKDAKKLLKSLFNRKKK